MAREYFRRVFEVSLGYGCLKGQIIQTQITYFIISSSFGLNLAVFLRSQPHKFDALVHAEAPLGVE